VWWVVSWTWQLQLEVGVFLVWSWAYGLWWKYDTPKESRKLSVFSTQAFESESRTIDCARQCQHISDTDTDVLPYNHIHHYFWVEVFMIKVLCFRVPWTVAAAMVGLAYWNDISRNNTDLCQLDFSVENKILGADVLFTPLQSSMIIFNPWVATGNCGRQIDW